MTVTKFSSFLCWSAGVAVLALGPAGCSGGQRDVKEAVVGEPGAVVGVANGLVQACGQFEWNVPSDGLPDDFGHFLG